MAQIQPLGRRGGCRALAALLLLACGCASAAGLRLDKRIELPGTAGRLDHLAVDLDRGELYVAALGADELQVVDLKAGQRVERITGLREPQGVVFSPKAQRLLVANGQGESIAVFKARRHEVDIEGLADADNLRLDEAGGRLYAGYSNGLAVVDNTTRELLDRIPLPGHPEGFEVAAGGLQVYVNVPSAGAVIVVDRRTRKETARWPVAPAAANYPMALDETTHRLFVATRAPAGLQVFDTVSGQRVAQRPLCGDADDLFLDAEKHRLYAICGEGRVVAVSLGNGDRYDEVSTTETSPGARTGLLVPRLMSLFVAAPASRGKPAAILVYRTD